LDRRLGGGHRRLGRDGKETDPFWLWKLAPHITSLQYFIILKIENKMQWINATIVRDLREF
jgi:hypothetical protein